MMQIQTVKRVSGDLVTGVKGIPVLVWGSYNFTEFDTITGNITDFYGNLSAYSQETYPYIEILLRKDYVSSASLISSPTNKMTYIGSQDFRIGGFDWLMLKFSAPMSISAFNDNWMLVVVPTEQAIKSTTVIAERQLQQPQQQQSQVQVITQQGMME